MMPVVSLPAPMVVPENELDRVVQLAVTLSGRLTRADLPDIAPAIADALADVAAATRADSCRLVEFTGSGSLAGTHLPRSAGADQTALDDGLLDRLGSGELVAVTRAAPRPFSLLGVPASVGGHVVCALVIENVRIQRRWPPTLVERLQLLSEILAAALQRIRYESALLANGTLIERLNTRLEADNLYLKEEIKSYHDFDDIVGESAALRLALARVAQVAPTASTVLLLGPTGSGKELFARALHERSRRHARPLVRVNCAALPPTLVESELFGHEKGAFTGAVTTRQGRFELADGGTIFLDEIGDLSPEVQVKFLRVLQEGEFERVGSSRTKRVDVRVIAATHQDLDAAIAARTFRVDLYYRLNVYPIRLPALRERAEDIPRLVWFFINRHQRELARHITTVPPMVMEALQRQAWPGNVRELENVVERAMIATTGDVLRLDEPLAVKSSPDSALTGADDLDAMQRAHIEAVLARCGWRINGNGNAAERLGIHPNTLRFRMKKLHVACPPERGRLPRLTPRPQSASSRAKNL
jgi:formate hydrogenlyase transcriptional activator